MALADTREAVFEYTEQYMPSNDSDHFGTDYAELKRLVKEQGLFDRQPAYYYFKFALTYGMLALSIFILLAFDDFGLQLLNAVFLAFAYAQIGMLGHDLGHRQITRTAWKIDLLGLLVGNLSIGMSETWWVDKHNEHHAHPNEVDLDPDIDFPIVVFSESQIQGKRPFQRFIIKYQAYFFFPLLALVSFNMHMHSILVPLNRSKPVKYRALELLALALHYAIYFALVFTALPGWQGLIFVFLHQAMFGVYMGGIFAPNHKGMPVLEKGHQLDFLRLQVLTARNIRAHPATDFLYGGLNYQVEHHLFPSVPRNKLREVNRICRQFCQEKGIPLYETGPFRSYVEIVTYLHEVSQPLREGKV